MAGYATLAAAFAAVKKFDFDARIDADLASVMSLGLPHVGTSAPVTFYPGKLWMDTTSGAVVLKVCTAVAEGSATWTACFTSGT